LLKLVSEKEYLNSRKENTACQLEENG